MQCYLKQRNKFSLKGLFSLGASHEVIPCVCAQAKKTANTSSITHRYSLRSSALHYPAKKFHIQTGLISTPRNNNPMCIPHTPVFFLGFTGIHRDTLYLDTDICWFGCADTCSDPCSSMTGYLNPLLEHMNTTLSSGGGLFPFSCGFSCFCFPSFQQSHLLCRFPTFSFSMCTGTPEKCQY